MASDRGPLLHSFAEFLYAEGWEFFQAVRKPQLLLYVGREHSPLACVIEAHESEHLLLVRALFPARVSADKLSDVEDYVTLANMDVIIGNFELDLFTGTVAYKTSIDVEGVPLTPSLLRPLIERAIAAADKHFLGLMPVLFGSVRPLEALHHAERCTLAQAIDLASDLMEE